MEHGTDNHHWHSFVGCLFLFFSNSNSHLLRHIRNKCERNFIFFPAVPSVPLENLMWVDVGLLYLLSLCMCVTLDLREACPHSPSKKKSYGDIARDSISSTEGEVWIRTHLHFTASVKTATRCGVIFIETNKQISILLLLQHLICFSPHSVQCACACVHVCL